MRRSTQTVDSIIKSHAAAQNISIHEAIDNVWDAVDALGLDRDGVIVTGSTVLLPATASLLAQTAIEYLHR